MRQGKVEKVEKVFLTDREAQVYLGVSQSTMKRFRAHLLINYYKLGGLIWYKKSDLDRLVLSHSVL